MVTPGVTAVTQDAAQLGAAAVGLLLDRIADPGRADPCGDAPRRHGAAAGRLRGRLRSFSGVGVGRGRFDVGSIPGYDRGHASPRCCSTAPSNSCAKGPALRVAGAGLPARDRSMPTRLCGGRRWRGWFDADGAARGPQLMPPRLGAHARTGADETVRVSLDRCGIRGAGMSCCGSSAHSSVWTRRDLVRAVHSPTAVELRPSELDGDGPTSPTCRCSGGAPRCECGPVAPFRSGIRFSSVLTPSVDGAGAARAPGHHHRRARGGRRRRPRAAERRLLAAAARVRLLARVAVGPRPRSPAATGSGCGCALPSRS